MSFKDISQLELWQPCIKPIKTISAILVEVIMRNKKRTILVEGIIRNISVKLF